MCIRDRTEAHDGTRSLRIDFGAPGNLTYQHIFEFAPVEADTDYEFTGYLRAVDITSEMCIRDRFSRERAKRRSSAIRNDGTPKQMCDWPVSYTHLDVYKRQPNTMFSRERAKRRSSAMRNDGTPRQMCDWPSSLLLRETSTGSGRGGASIGA